MKRKFLVILCMGLCILLTGCKWWDTAPQSSEADSPSYEILHPIVGAEEYYVGQIEPDSELQQYGLYRIGEYGAYQFITQIAQGELPRIKGYQNKIYFIKYDRLFLIDHIDQEEPSEPVSLTPTDRTYNEEKGFLLSHIRKITDDWIYLSAKKRGVNEYGLSVNSIPTFVAISSDGERWKEIEENDIP